MGQIQMTPEQLAVRDQAEKEFKEEKFKKAVEREKERLARRENFWIRVFPWRLYIERRDLPQRLIELQKENDALWTKLSSCANEAMVWRTQTMKAHQVNDELREQHKKEYQQLKTNYDNFMKEVKKC